MAIPLALSKGHQDHSRLVSQIRSKFRKVMHPATLGGVLVFSSLSRGSGFVGEAILSISWHSIGR